MALARCAAAASAFPARRRSAPRLRRHWGAGRGLVPASWRPRDGSPPGPDGRSRRRSAPADTARARPSLARIARVIARVPDRPRWPLPLPARRGPGPLKQRVLDESGIGHDPIPVLHDQPLVDRRQILRPEGLEVVLLDPARRVEVATEPRVVPGVARQREEPGALLAPDHGPALGEVGLGLSVPADHGLPDCARAQG